MRNKKTLLMLLLVILAFGVGYFWHNSKHDHPKQEAASEESGHKHGEEKEDHGKNEEKDEHGHAHGEDEHGHGEEGGDKTEISEKAAVNSSIEVSEAGPANIHETVSLTGRVELNQNATAQVKARFAGIVKDVKKSIGETVTAGETLALVESNDSLQVYAVKSPISGTVLVRNTNAGDVAGEEPLFTIANLGNMWAELYVFPRDVNNIRSGQKVNIKTTDGSLTAEATIAAILPVTEASSQTVIARAIIDNSQGLWRSGMTIRGDAVTNEKQVAVAVKAAAIQRLEGSDVVFIRENEKYEARKVETGLKDDEWVEIKSGLNASEQYVSKNSFAVKADIGKNSAEHEH